MDHKPQSEWYGDASYQHYLTLNLVRSLGPENAREICRKNNWDEQLRLIMSEESDEACA